MTAPNNHEIFTSLMDTSDGKGADGVLHPDLKAKADATANILPKIRDSKGNLAPVGKEEGVAAIQKSMYDVPEKKLMKSIGLTKVNK